jgi:RNA polymerase sigma-70 factor (ECF subfamily)
MDDKQILDLYWERSEAAISETSKKYGKYCRYIASNILHNDEDSEECVNDTYLRAWNSIPPNRPSVLKTFLGKITRNLSLDRYELLNAKKRNGGQMSLIFDEIQECIPSLDSTENIVEEIALTDILNRFLSSLSLEQRKIFMRRYWYLSPIKEIATEYSFIKYTELELDDNGSIKQLSIPNKYNVIYAIAINDELVYIGKTKNLRKRINYYRTAINRKDKTSDSTKSALIHAALKEGSKVEFYARQCFNLSMTNELGTMTIATIDLEEPLFIKLFNPPWNIQHKKK